MGLRNVLEQLPGQLLLSPEEQMKRRQFEGEQSIRDMALTQAKQQFQNQQGLTNALQSAASNPKPMGPGATPLPLPQATPGAAGQMDLFMPKAEPLSQDPDRVAYEYAIKNGDLGLKNHIEDEVLKHASQVEKDAGPNAAFKMLKSKLGWTVEYDPKLDHQVVSDSEGTKVLSFDRTGLVKTVPIGPAKPERVTVGEGQKVFEKNKAGKFEEVAGGGEKIAPDLQNALQAEVDANPKKYPNTKAIPAARREEIKLGLDKKTAEAKRDPETVKLNNMLKVLALTKAKETSPGIDITKPLPSPADEKMAQDLASGKSAPSQLSRRSANYNAIVARASTINPNLDLMAAESGFAAGKSPQLQKVSRSLDAVKESLDLVRSASKEFGRSDVNVLNNIILKGEVQMNDPKAIRFQTYVNGLIDDVASALSGGGATTDQARNQARTLFNTSYSQGGMDAALNAVEDLLTKRRAAFTKGTYLGKTGTKQPTVGEVRGGYKFKGGDPSKKENWEKQ